jgi:hypothetical protein
MDPDPHSFGCPGSGSVLGMRIRIQSMEIDQNLQIDLVYAFQKGFFTFVGTGMFLPITYFKYIFHEKINFL